MFNCGYALLSKVGNLHILLRYSSYFTALSLIVVLSFTMQAWPQEVNENDPPVNDTENVVDDQVPVIDDGPTYPVSRIVLQYTRARSDYPNLSSINNLPIHLGLTEDNVYVEFREGLELVKLSLGDIEDSEEGIQISLSGLNVICETIVNYFNQQEGLIGIIVAPGSDNIDWLSGKDLRPADDGNDDLNLYVTVGVVSEMRTLASGTRIPLDNRINHYKDSRILERSPTRINDLLNKSELYSYVSRLNRHPGRRVDLALSAASNSTDMPGAVTLDYLVNENRPWMFYGQISNTGTKQTDNWRERFGFVHNQFTGHDDILTIDYITAGFNQAHAIAGSYEAPWFKQDRLHLRMFGNWSKYTASDVGQANETFGGESWSAGGEFVYNIFQKRELFVDVFAGARYQRISVNNKTVSVHGKEDFLLPRVGVSLERMISKSSTQASIDYEWSMPGVSGAGDSGVVKLGRLNTDKDWSVLHWNASHSLFLEPLLHPKAWADPSTYESSTLAHEIYIAVRGQYAFDNRLIPQAEDVVGGMHTVRGYPESVAAGDSTVIGNLEYRFHLPRIFKPRSADTGLLGQKFRWAPQQVYGMPDWDLMLRAFLDYGHTSNSDIQSYESNHTLVGSGVGFELMLRRNFNLSVDWGFALQGLAEEDVHTNSNRLHIAATIIF